MRFSRACVLVAALVAAIVAESRAGATPAAAVASGEVLLLDFSAPWCGPCRQMAPLLGEVEAAGWPVRHVDVDRELDLVRRFGVTGVPSYVLLVKGQEIGRINGATTRGELEKLLAQAASPLGGTALPSSSPSPVAVAGTPLPTAPATQPLATEPKVRTPPAEMPAAPRVSRESPPPRAAQPIAAVAPAASMPAGEREQLERRLMNATARIRVEDARGISWGTGTVIDCRQGEALILTCGHIFRDSQGKGRIEVDTFATRGPRGVAGQVVSWDLKRDLALVSIFTESSIEPVRVGAADRRTTAGDAVVTVGCDGGSDPTIHHSRVTAVDKYLGPANVQVAGQPVQGRSGGGLFAIDGTLIGVCNAADPSDNEGLFAALPAIHEQLEESGLAFVYRNVYPSGGADSVAVAGGSAHVPAMPAEMPPVSFDRRDRADAVPTASTTQADPRAAAATPGTAVSPGEQALIEQVRQHGGRAEVICIVRPRGAAEGESEVFVLKDAGRDFVGRLSEAHHGTAAPPRGGAVTRSDVATLPPAGPSR